jgi:hypothetical protein
MTTNPLCVKVRHNKEFFTIYTDEYNLSISIKEQVSKLKGITIDNIRLYYSNKRLIEDNVTNHDQQIKHGTLLFVAYKNEENGQFEHFDELAKID